MRVPTQAELDRWAAVAKRSGNSAEGGRIVRFGAVDLVAYSDGLHLRLLTPYPALWDVRQPESPEQPAMFERTSDGEIVFQIGGLTDLIKKMSQDPTAPAGRLRMNCWCKSRLGKRIPSSSRRIRTPSRSAYAMMRVETG
jgi:hypothetical protein